MYQIIELKNMNVEEAAALCMQEYMEESKSIRNMPPIDGEREDAFAGTIEWVKTLPYGKALLYEEKLVGFVAFVGPIEGLHGVAKGAFSPLGASAFAGKDRRKTVTLLLEAVGAELIRDEVYSIAMSRYTGNKEVNEALCLNSFGIRCSDAILSLQDYSFDEGECALLIEELQGTIRWEVAPLYEELIGHLVKGPCFFPTRKNQIERWFENSGLRIFAARKDGRVVGYMAVCDEAETFLANRSDVINICGAYVLPEYRHMGVAKQLLDTVAKESMEEGYRYLGVDYETVNPTALRFWTKNFAPYTYSFIRRIDERIGHYESR